MKEALIEYIKGEILNYQSNVEVSTEEDLLGSGLIDSMGMMKLVAFIEESNSIKIPPEDLLIENFMTVDAIALYLESHQ